MKKRLVVLFVIAILTLSFCTLFACHDKTPPPTEEVEEHIVEKFSFKDGDVTIRTETQKQFLAPDKIITIAKVQNYSDKIFSYKLRVVPSYNKEFDAIAPMFKNTKGSPSIIDFTFDDLSDYRTIIVIVSALDEENSVIDTIEIEFKYVKDEEDILIDIEDNNGVVEGLKDPTYFYVKYQENIAYTKSTTNDMAMILSEGDIIKSLEAPFLNKDDWFVDDNKHVLVVKQEYLKSFSLGTKLLTKMNINDHEVSFYINITNGLPLQLSTSNLTYNKYTFDKMSVKVITTENKYTYITAITLDGKKIDKGYYKSTGNELIFVNSIFDKLERGYHEIRLYFYKDSVELGYSTVNIYVDDKDYAPYNLKIDYDKKAPNVFVTWESKLGWDHAIVQIDTNIYSTRDEAYKHLFAGNTFNAFEFLQNKDSVVKVTLVKDEKNYISNEVVMDTNLANVVVKTHLNNKIDFIGEVINSYISDYYELKEFCAYNIIHYPDNDYNKVEAEDLPQTYTIYSPYLNKKTIAEIATELRNAYSAFIEPISVTIYQNDIIKNDDKSITYTVHQYSGGTRPYTQKVNYSQGETYKYKEYENVDLHYYKPGQSQRSSTFEGFKVNNVERLAKVSTSVELYLALERGYKPICMANSSAESVYDEAKKILREIVDDNMDDYQKVLAIYDWISYEVLYDRGLTKYISTLSPGTPKYQALFKSRAFFAEGVFFDKVAQCNGIAAAFSILCNIEGIQCKKIIGSVASGKHAWNKVYISGEWYVCDPTWSNAKMQIDNQLYEYIIYDYFMLSLMESTQSAERTEYSGMEFNYYYAGDGQYNYWASQLFVYEEKIYDHIISNKGEFDILLKYYTAIGDKAIISKGEEKQISIKTTYFLANDWLGMAKDAELYDKTKYSIVIFARGNDGNGSSGSQEDDTVYLRITAL